MLGRVAAAVVGVAFVSLLVSCGVANLLQEGPDVWSAYQDGYASGQAHAEQDGSVHDRCERASLQRYGSNWNTEKAFAFAAGCGDGATGLPMQSEETVQDSFGDLPNGD